MLPWIAEYCVLSLLLFWVMFWGGARRLDGSWFAELVGYLGVTTSADGLKLMAGIVWIGRTIWFVWGLFDASIRLW